MENFVFVWVFGWLRTFKTAGPLEPWLFFVRTLLFNIASGVGSSLGFWAQRYARSGFRLLGRQVLGSGLWWAGSSALMCVCSFRGRFKALFIEALVKHSG